MQRPVRPPLSEPVALPMVVAFVDTQLRVLTPTPRAPVTLVGTKLDAHLSTMPDGVAAMDLAELATPAWPLARPLGTLQSPSAPDLPLQLPSEVAARLAHLRGRIRDLDDFLALYAEAPEVPQVQQWRAERLARDDLEQRALTAQALALLDADDFPGAYQRTEACRAIGEPPWRRCQEAERQVLERFVQRQASAVGQAIAQGQFDAAEAAAWLCRIGTRDHPGCQLLMGRIRQGRLDFIRQQAEIALVRDDFGLASALASRCHELAPDEVMCRHLADKIAIEKDKWRQAKIDAECKRGKLALRQRRWQRAAAAAEACLLVAPDAPQCRLLAKLAACRGRRCP